MGEALTRVETDVRDAVVALEQRRCEVVNAHEIEALADLLAPEYVHVHATGLVEDRRAAIESFRTISRKMSRGELHVRSFGDLAIIVGRQFNLLNLPERAPLDVTLRVTQVARRDGDQWRFVHFHGCKIGPLE